MLEYKLTFPKGCVSPRGSFIQFIANALLQTARLNMAGPTTHDEQQLTAVLNQDIY